MLFGTHRAGAMGKPFTEHAVNFDVYAVLLFTKIKTMNAFKLNNVCFNVEKTDRVISTLASMVDLDPKAEITRIRLGETGTCVFIDFQFEHAISIYIFGKRIERNNV